MRTRRTLPLLLLAGTISACGPYAYRQSGTPIPGFGNAIRQNAAVQIVDPQPAGAANTTIDMDGRRALLAIEAYRTGTVLEPTELSTTEIVPVFSDESGGDAGSAAPQ